MIADAKTVLDNKSASTAGAGAAGAEAGAGATGASEPKKGGDDVIDADFKDVN